MTAFRPLGDWAALGVRAQNGAPLPKADINAALVSGATRHFLVYGNYDALLSYNCAHAYAVSVALLADRLGGARPLRQPSQPAVHPARPLRRSRRHTRRRAPWPPQPERHKEYKEHSGVSALEVDDRGLLVTCAELAVRRNRLGFRTTGRPGPLRSNCKTALSPPSTPLDVAIVGRLRATGRTRVPADRRGLLGAVVRTVSDGGARAGEAVAGRASGRWLVVKVNTDVLSDLGERFGSARFRRWRSLRMDAKSPARRERDRPPTSKRSCGRRLSAVRSARDRASARLRPRTFTRTTPAATRARAALPAGRFPSKPTGRRFSAARCCSRTHMARASSSIGPRGSAPCIETTASTDCPMRVSTFRDAPSSTIAASSSPFRTSAPRRPRSSCRATQAPAIVEGPAGVSADRRYEGLDGRGAWPPLVKADRPVRPGELHALGAVRHLLTGGRAWLRRQPRWRRLADAAEHRSGRGRHRTARSKLPSAHSRCGPSRRRPAAIPERYRRLTDS